MLKILGFHCVLNFDVTAKLLSIMSFISSGWTKIGTNAINRMDLVPATVTQVGESTKNIYHIGGSVEEDPLNNHLVLQTLLFATSSFQERSLRGLVYVLLPRNTSELTANFRAEITTFTSEPCRKAYDPFVCRCSLYIEQEGALFESLL